MFCPYCGNPCADTHKFCFRCGKPLPEPVSEDTVLPVIPDEEPKAAFAATEDYTELPIETAAAASELAVDPVPDDRENPPYLPEPEQPADIPPQPKKGRLWPPLLALCLMICVGLSAYFLSPREPEPPKTCFSVESGVLYFDYSLYTGSDELTVPETVDGMAVTAISDSCFADCDRLTTIILPDTVTVIGEKAFSGCDNLRGIYIPEGVLSIGAGALAQCPALEAVAFPQSIAEIGDGCLDDCSSLQHIFYDGTYTQWRELYKGTFRTGVKLYTNDGTYAAQP